MTGLLDASEAGSMNGGPSFTLQHRLFRAFWNVTWMALGCWTPPPMHGWRRLLLQAFGAKIAKTARIYGSAKIWYPPNLEMDEYSVLGPNSYCYNMDNVTIEEYATVSQFAFLLGGTHDIADSKLPVDTQADQDRPLCLGRSMLHRWAGH